MAAPGVRGEDAPRRTGFPSTSTTRARITEAGSSRNATGPVFPVLDPDVLELGREALGLDRDDRRPRIAVLSVNSPRSSVVPSGAFEPQMSCPRTALAPFTGLPAASTTLPFSVRPFVRTAVTPSRSRDGLAEAVAIAGVLDPDAERAEVGGGLVDPPAARASVFGVPTWNT